MGSPPTPGETSPTACGRARTPRCPWQPAARAYLDVAFIHPYPDGNARLALLILASILKTEGVRLDQVGPLHTARYADDPAGAADLAALVSVLIRATLRRATPTTQR